MTLPSDPASQLAMQGQQAMRAGMYDQATQYFAQALQYAPNSDALYYHYASACAWRGMPNDALVALDRCMALRGPWFNHGAQLAQQIRMQMGTMAAPQPASATSPAAEANRKKKGIGWGKVALGVVGAAAVGTAIGMSGATDGIAEDIADGADDIFD